MPRISVALGTHNGERFLGEQLRSILDQSHPVDEIVLSDDASRDSTIGVAEQAVAAAGDDGRPVPTLIVLRNDSPLGVTGNFAQALQAATGDLILLCDQDDRWHVDRVADALACFATDPELQLVASDARLVDEHGAPLPHSLFDTLGIDEGLLARIAAGGASSELLKRNLFTGATMAVRRELVERAAPFPASWVHDEWLAIVASVTGGLVVIDAPLIDYRQHGGNQIGVTKLELDGKLSRLREPRSDRNARLLARAEALAARAAEFAPTDQRFIREVDEKVQHELVRRDLPRRRVQRIAPVLGEWRTGRYSRFGLGAQDVLRDLVQPV
ncbi:glycosyltransferase family 2 protein [Agromyces agglutinans]|uniref:glycosyltransferase family 2 protein n=1 Tax=Agromyces agglutinans TaxID=2662258 RepID=UPI0035E41D60